MSSFAVELIAEEPVGSGFPQSYSLPVVNHIHKRVESFLYTDLIQDTSVPVAYIENKEIDSRANIVMVNRSYCIPANSEAKLELRTPWLVTTSTSVTSEYSEVSITNKTFVDELGVTRPLFFRHDLPSDTVEATLRSFTNGEGVDVDTGYTIDLDQNVIYTNYQNRFNLNTGGYRLFYVLSTDSSGEQTHTLLSPKPVAKEATWEDIDLSTGAMTTAYPVYTKERNSNGFTFYMNTGDTWYVKPIAKSLIQPRLPAGRKPTDAWYLRFTAGEVNAVTNSASRRYFVPEYDQQPFAPSKPYLFSPYDVINYVNDHAVAATRENLAIDPDVGRHCTILAYDVEGTLLRAFTTDQGLSGSRFSDTSVFYETDVIGSLDNKSGIITLNTKIHPSWTLSASYFYEADDYEYTRVNLNPLTNKKVLDYMYVFYLVPDVDETDDHAIHHLVVDREGIIVECSQDLGFGHPNLQLKDSSGAYNSNTVVGRPYITDDGSACFIDLATVGYSNSRGYAILAEVNVMDIGLKEKQVVYDVRRRGNSIYDSKLSTALRANPRLLFSEIGTNSPDGFELPEAATMHIRLPYSLLEDYGGSLTKEKALSLATQHLNSSVLPLIEWYGYSSDIDLIPLSNGQVQVDMSWEGTGIDYKIYRKDTAPDAWTEIHSFTSTSTRSTISYTDTTATYDKTYYYKVTLTVDSVEYPEAYYTSVRTVRAP